MHARVDWTPAPARRRADPFRGLVAGTLAGLLASGFMNGFQALTADLKPKSDAEPRHRDRRRPDGAGDDR